MIYLLPFQLEKKSCLLKSTPDLRCIQYHVNSWTLDAPKVSLLFLTNGAFFPACTPQPI